MRAWLFKTLHSRESLSLNSLLLFVVQEQGYRWRQGTYNPGPSSPKAFPGLTELRYVRNREGVRSPEPVAVCLAASTT